MNHLIPKVRKMAASMSGVRKGVGSKNVQSTARPAADGHGQLEGTASARMGVFKGRGNRGL